MACHGIEALANNPSTDVSVMFNPSNTKLGIRLREMDLPTCPTGSGWPSAQPDLVLCIQGDLTQSIGGLKAARNTGAECVSYLALPHSLAVMGARLGTLRDRLNQHNVNLADRYISISGSMKKKLIMRGCTKPIHVVPNGINTATAVRGQRYPSHAPPCTLGLAGRFEFKQKQQDFMINAFRNHLEAFQGCQLLIAGDGPDEKALHRLIDNHDTISLLPWQQDMDAFYNRIDFLIIPSRYEGVPLVMLEALARGIPVIGSNRDGMKEVLPDAWTFESGNPAALAETFSRVRDTWQDDIDSLRENVLQKHSLDAFKSNFCNAVLGK